MAVERRSNFDQTRVTVVRGQTMKLPMIIVFIAFLLLLLLFVLHLITLVIAIDWKLSDPEESSKLSNALGLFSALFAGFAALGLLYTINLQREALALQQLDAKQSSGMNLRLLHIELQKLAIQDPDLSAVWTSTEQKISEKESLYVNLILSHWELMFENNQISEQQLVSLITERMKGPFVAFWKKTRDFRKKQATHSGGKSPQFHETIEEAYQTAIS